MEDYGVRILTPPTLPAITLAQAKKSLEIDEDFTEDDGLVQELIDFAVDFLETGYDIRLSAQRVEYSLGSFPRGNRFPIRIWPVQEVEYFKYTDSGGNETTLVENTNWKAKLTSYPAEIVLPYNATWPGVTLDTVDPLKLGLLVGFVTGDSPEPLPRPACIFQSLRLLIGEGFEERAPRVNDTTAAVIRTLMVNVKK